MNEDKAIGPAGVDVPRVGEAFAERVLQDAQRAQGDALATVLAHRAAFLALDEAGQEGTLERLVNQGAQTRPWAPVLAPGNVSLPSRCAWTLALGDALPLTRDTPPDADQAAQRVTQCRGRFEALGERIQQLVLNALVNDGLDHANHWPGPDGSAHALARFTQTWTLALGSPLPLSPRVGTGDAARLALDFRGGAVSGRAWREPVVRALLNAGLVYANAPWISDAGLQSLARWTQAWTLVLGDALPLPQGRRVDVVAAVDAAISNMEVFDSHSSDTRATAVRALIQAAGFLREQGLASKDAGLARLAQPLTLALGDVLMLTPPAALDLGGCDQTDLGGRNLFRMLGALDEEVLVAALANFGFQREDLSGKAALLAFLSLLPRSAEHLSAWVRNRDSTSALYNRHAPVLAANWIRRNGALPTDRDRPGQVDTLLQLTSQLLAMERRQAGPLRSLVRQAGQERPEASALARELARQQGWPVAFEDQAHWLLALGLARDALLWPGPDPAWAIDARRIAHVCQWQDCCLDDGHARRSYVLAPPLTPANPLDATRWQLDDTEHARWAQWLNQLSDTGSVDAAQAAMEDWWAQALPVAQAMCAWRQRWLPQEPHEAAWQHSVRAMLLAQADRFVEQVWAQCTGGLPSWPQGLPLSAEQPASADSMSNLWLSWLGPGHSVMSERLLQAQHHWADHRLRLHAEPAVVWRLLELSRHQLLPAKPASARWQDWDAEALRVLDQAELRVLRDARARLEAIEQRQPEPPNCLNADHPIEPFATMAQQWARMGVGLDIPTPQATALALAPGEALVQLWWAADGLGQALVNGAQGLQQTHLPPALAASLWAPLTEAWRAAQQADTSAGLDAPDAAQRLGAESLRDTAFAAAWQCMAEPGGVAVAAWQWLRDQAALLGCQRLIVVWPADKAAWPWQALAEALEPPETGLTLELAVSAAALLQSRRNAAQPAAAAHPPPGHAALFTEDLWRSEHPGETLACRIEASVLPQALRERARRSADAADCLQALQANGLVHLAAHGVYDEERPWSSHLVLHAPGSAAQAPTDGPTRRHARRRFVAPQVDAPAALAPAARSGGEPVALPVWLIAELALAQPEVSLSACQVMRTGQGAGAAALRGPMGLGAMLSSAGARTVVGSLWVCDSLAMAVFYDRWFHHRTGQEALHALRLARQDLRAMSWSDLDRWLDQGLQHARADGLISPAQQQHLLHTGRLQAAEQQAIAWASGRQAGPFVHPADWAGLCLIGNAPPRPSALQRPPHAAAATPAPLSGPRRFLARLRSALTRKPSL